MQKVTGLKTKWAGLYHAEDGTICFDASMADSAYAGSTLQPCACLTLLCIKT